MFDITKVNWKKVGIFASGVLFGTAGIKALSSKDAKNVYTNCTAAVLRAKDCVMKTATNIHHLTYVGDSEVGESYNFGCGTVTVNYDGTNKHKTVIGNNSFIGCNTNLISPVTIEDNSYIAAGSTITNDVHSGELAVARAKQRNIEGWVDKRGLIKKK